jgi:hypothetical protein
MLTHQFALACAALALCACTSSPVEDQFGNSVRELNAGQTLDPQTRANPSDKPVIGADSYAVSAAVDAMRKDQPKRSEVKRDVVINVGGEQGR